jgi:Sigma-70 region 2
VQDVFLHAYRKCQLFDPQRGSFRGWLIRMTCRRALDRREYLNLHRFYDDRNLEDFVDVFQATTNLEYEAQCIFRRIAEMGRHLLLVLILSTKIPITRRISKESVKVCTPKFPSSSNNSALNLSALNVFANRSRIQPEHFR